MVQLQLNTSARGHQEPTNDSQISATMTSGGPCIPKLFLPDLRSLQTSRTSLEARELPKHQEFNNSHTCNYYWTKNN